MAESAKETWGGGEGYERYVGRWSRRVAAEFAAWLNVGPGRAWCDVGCGTGALTACALSRWAPAAVAALDRAPGFVRAARGAIRQATVRFAVGDALALPWPANACEAAVSGLVLNFVSDPRAMTAEMARVTRPGGSVGAYVWDYAGGMEMMRHFWDVAVALSPHDAALDQAERFPLCRPEPLESLFREVGLGAVTVRAIDIPTVFRDFDDYWGPFLGKQGAAPTYLARLAPEARERIRAELQARLAPRADGTIALNARAWAVQGVVPLR